MVRLFIDGTEVETAEGTTILKAALKSGIYIPHLCFHPDLPSLERQRPAAFVYRGNERIENKKPGLLYEGCQLCVVEVEGKEGLQRACITHAEDKMVVKTVSPKIDEFRQDRLMFLIAKHPHACMTCAQKEGCARFPCSMDRPEVERCCSRFGKCEFQKLSEYIKLRPETPRYVFEDLPFLKNDPLFERNYNVCVGCTRCIRACRDIRGVEAINFVFDDEGRVIIGTTKPSLKDSGCRFCTACVEVCPTGTLMDKTSFDLAPCKFNCPAEIDVPRYIRFIKEKNYAAATTVIREKVPFPKVLGYVCDHPCESACRRAEVNQAISIRELKRFAAEHDDGMWEKHVSKKPPTDKKVAIIGSGPAGLTAAYYLANQGHTVKVFESQLLAGGMLRYGIPEYRLPREVLDSEIKDIERMGVSIETSSTIQLIDALFHEGFDVVLVTVGAHKGAKLPIPGADSEGVLVSIDLLRDVNSGKRPSMGEKVIVLGGGNVAFDCARVARRLGAKEVLIVCLESRSDMPAASDEIEQGEEEGIVLYPSRTFTRIVTDNSKIKGVECLNVQSFSFDEDRNLEIEVLEGSEHLLEADTVIVAVGQRPDIPDGFSLDTNSLGLVELDPYVFTTSREGVFAAGDAVMGSSSVIKAIASGRKGAIAIDRFLEGMGDIDERLAPLSEPEKYLGPAEGFALMSRCEESRLMPDQRLQSFCKVLNDMDEEEAVRESSRCLQCDLRLLFEKPVLPPKKRLWRKFTTENIDTIPDGKEGVFQLLDENEQVIFIKGAVNLKNDLKDQLEMEQRARFFQYQLDEMYTKRESELLQHYMQEHGKQPLINAEFEDLF